MIRNGRMGIGGQALAALALAGGLIAPGLARGQEFMRDDQRFVTEGQYRGAADCKGCHSRPTADRARGEHPPIEWCLLTEYSTWRLMDKHSLAYAVLEGPRGRKMGELLGIDRVQDEARCLSCHALDIPEEQVNPTYYSKNDGVNCEACHGPADGIGDQPGWYGPHSDPDWRERTPAEKAEFGFIDLRVPEAKVTLCFSCHIGDAELGRVVTHPMYAAGHPPLPSIDVAAFVKNEPQHWRDQDNVSWWEYAPEELRETYGIRENKMFETEVSFASALLSLRESMELIAERADLGDLDGESLQAWPELTLHPSLKGDLAERSAEELEKLARGRWPEMAMTHLDCAGCHHNLRFPGWRQDRGFPVAPGRPLPRNWSSPVVRVALDLYGDQALRSEYESSLQRLNQAFGSQPYGNPGELVESAGALREWADRFFDEQVADVPFEVDSAPRIMRALCEQALNRPPDYDSARQIAATLDVVYREWSRMSGSAEVADEGIAEILAELERALNLGRYPFSEERDNLSLRVFTNVVRGEPGGDLLSGFGEWTPGEMPPGSDFQEFYQVARENEVLSEMDDASQYDLREAYLEPGFKADLQEINNRGLARSLEIAQQYEPGIFQRQIADLLALLPPS